MPAAPPAIYTPPAAAPGAPPVIHGGAAGGVPGIAISGITYPGDFPAFLPLYSETVISSKPAFSDRQYTVYWDDVEHHFVILRDYDEIILFSATQDLPEAWSPGVIWTVHPPASGIVSITESTAATPIGAPAAAHAGYISMP